MLNQVVKFITFRFIFILSRLNKKKNIEATTKQLYTFTNIKLRFSCQFSISNKNKNTFRMIKQFFIIFLSQRKITNYLKN